MSSMVPCAPSNITLWPSRDGLVQQRAGVGDEGRDAARRRAAYSSYILAGSSGVGAEKRVRDGVLLVAGVLDVRLEQIAGSAGRSRAARCAPSCLHTPGRCRGWWCRSSAVRERSPPPARSCGDRAESPARGWRQKAARPRPRPASRSLPTSLRKAMGSSTTPLPMTARQSGRSTPQGTSCSTNFCPPNDDGVPGIVAAGIARDDARSARRARRRFFLCLHRPTGHPALPLSLLASLSVPLRDCHPELNKELYRASAADAHRPHSCAGTPGRAAPRSIINPRLVAARCQALVHKPMFPGANCRYN